MGYKTIGIKHLLWTSSDSVEKMRSGIFWYDEKGALEISQYSFRKITLQTRWFGGIVWNGASLISWGMTPSVA
ncbi:hypothetical protein TNCV_209931 [Trichonephila clavipes]|uniref:Uncharacterized protein n=1 Tax=Trichonephila clavipes TaxID=2585209 RepID=A0A8X6T514_TRICX|nr:hypothetical protein TNCV_209931 [Trichonephila clavipes]